MRRKAKGGRREAEDVKRESVKGQRHKAIKMKKKGFNSPSAIKIGGSSKGERRESEN